MRGAAVSRGVGRSRPASTARPASPPHAAHGDEGGGALWGRGARRRSQVTEMNSHGRPCIANFVRRARCDPAAPPRATSFSAATCASLILTRLVKRLTYLKESRDIEVVLVLPHPDVPLRLAAPDDLAAPMPSGGRVLDRKCPGAGHFLSRTRLRIPGAGVCPVTEGRDLTGSWRGACVQASGQFSPIPLPWLPVGQ